jgi:hypothetical protein
VSAAAAADTQKLCVDSTFDFTARYDDARSERKNLERLTFACLGRESGEHARGMGATGGCVRQCWWHLGTQLPCTLNGKSL